MFEAFLQFLQDPTVQETAQACIATAVVSTGAASINPLLKAKKETHEWQLLNCLESALFQTEKKYHWRHQTEAIYDTFFTSLFTFSGTFSIASLKQIFQDSLDRTVTDEELNTWIENFLKQLSLKKHTNLREFIKLHHLLEDKPSPKRDNPSPILSPGASVWDDKNILARDEFIDSLCADFSQHPRRIQLVGMGGIGKTEILNKLYAKLAAKPAECGFDFIGLVHFSGAIESDLGQQIEPPKGYLGMQGAEAALRYLRDVCTEHHVLLLIDDIRAQQPLPKAKDNPLQYLTTLGASVLLASRVPFAQFDKRDVAVIPTDKCIEIFERQYDRTATDEEERTLLTKIIEDKAGQNTLIVNRLGGMAKDPGWSIKELFDHLEAQQFSIPKGAADDETLQHEIKKLYILDKEFSPAEISILEAFSIFPAIPLALDLCKEWLSSDAGVGPDECARILARLAQKTWLIRHEGEEGASAPMYSMHQTVKAATRDQLKTECAKHINLLISCRNCLRDCTIKYKFSIASQIVPFATTIFEESSEENALLVYLSVAISSYLYAIAAYLLALQWWLVAAALAEKTFGFEHEYTATTYSGIADVYKKLGDYPKALMWYFKDLTITEKVQGKEHPSTATIYNNIAIVYDSQGNYSKALEWYFMALTISERELGKEHPDTATTYNNIALVFSEQGDYSKALEWYAKALVVEEISLGKEHPSFATTCNNIAVVYDCQCNYSRALEWYFKALEIQEKVLGKDHPSTATTYNNIAMSYYNQGDLALAVEWYFKAQEVKEKVFGKGHPSTAITYNNTAMVYQEQGDYPKALEWFFKALTIREKVLGKAHPSTATTYNNIASVYQMQGDYSNALQWHVKALCICEKILGKEHPDTAGTYYNIAWVLYYQGKFQSALKWFQKALPIFEIKLGSEHPYTKGARKGIEIVTAKLAESSPT